MLELASVVMGPWAGQILGDMGADVIKIEPPRGDSNRQLGPSRSDGMAALYLTCNRNKRSVVLDLKKPAGKDALLRMARDADVLLHNFRPQAMDRLGLDYATLKSLNPGIIYCAAYGYGRRGPYGENGALDDSIQAASGAAALMAHNFGEPRYLPTIVADKTTGLTMVYTIAAALFHRERTGVGQEIEVPMFETMAHFVMCEHLWGEAFDPALDKPGYVRLMSEHRRPYPTKDGYIAVLPYMNAHWAQFCTAAGRPELIDDPRFRTMANRTRNIDETYAETGRILATKTTAEWFEILAETSVPTMVVNSLESLMTDPHLNAVGFWESVEHPTEGSLKTTAFPANFSATPASVRRHAPRLGEHSVELLSEAGLSEEAIAAMVEDGATTDGRE